MAVAAVAFAHFEQTQHGYAGGQTDEGDGLNGLESHFAAFPVFIVGKPVARFFLCFLNDIVVHTGKMRAVEFRLKNE